MTDPIRIGTPLADAAAGDEPADVLIGSNLADLAAEDGDGSPVAEPLTAEQVAALPADIPRVHVTLSDGDQGEPQWTWGIGGTRRFASVRWQLPRLHNERNPGRGLICLIPPQED